MKIYTRFLPTILKSKKGAVNLLMILFLAFICTFIIATIQSRLVLQIIRFKSVSDSLKASYSAESAVYDVMRRTIAYNFFPNSSPSTTLPDGTELTLETEIKPGPPEEKVVNVVAKRPYAVTKLEGIRMAANSIVGDNDFDLVLSVDCTGSMKNIDIDSGNARWKDAELAIVNLIDFLIEMRDVYGIDTHLGIMTFATGAEWMPTTWYNKIEGGMPDNYYVYNANGVRPGIDDIPPIVKDANTGNIAYTVPGSGRDDQDNFVVSGELRPDIAMPLEDIKKLVQEGFIDGWQYNELDPSNPEIVLNPPGYNMWHGHPLCARVEGGTSIGSGLAKTNDYFRALIANEFDPFVRIPVHILISDGIPNARATDGAKCTPSIKCEEPSAPGGFACFEHAIDFLSCRLYDKTRVYMPNIAPIPGPPAPQGPPYSKGTSVLNGTRIPDIQTYVLTIIQQPPPAPPEPRKQFNEAVQVFIDALGDSTTDGNYYRSDTSNNMGDILQDIMQTVVESKTPIRIRRVID